MEARLPDIGGLDVFHRLAAVDTSPPVIFLSEVEDVSTAVQALREGAVNWLQKPVRTAELWAAMEKAIALDRDHRHQRRCRRQIEDRLNWLSRRESEVLLEFGNGRSTREIAERLGISIRAVELTRKRIMNKLEISTPLEILQYALAARERS